ncbi:MAG: hypothetical protein R3228_13180, partial [Halioglobus sp.]|nr:hypothetical protein [Halioglobus sp.]
MKLDHINIAAPAPLLEAAKDFYCNALQLQVGYRPDFGIPGYWLYGGDDPIVHLIESDNHGAGDTPYYLDHVAFALQGLPDFLARLDALGVQYGVIRNEELDLSQV